MKLFGVGFLVRLFGRCPFNEGFTKHLFVNGGGVRLKSCADAVTEVLSRSAGWAKIWLGLRYGLG